MKDSVRKYMAVAATDDQPLNTDSWQHVHKAYFQEYSHVSCVPVCGGVGVLEQPPSFPFQCVESLVNQQAKCTAHALLLSDLIPTCCLQILGAMGG